MLFSTTATTHNFIIYCGKRTIYCGKRTISICVALMYISNTNTHKQVHKCEHKSTHHTSVAPTQHFDDNPITDILIFSSR